MSNINHTCTGTQVILRWKIGNFDSFAIKFVATVYQFEQLTMKNRSTFSNSCRHIPLCISKRKLKYGKKKLKYGQFRKYFCWLPQSLFVGNFWIFCWPRFGRFYKVNIWGLCKKLGLVVGMDLNFLSKIIIIRHT